MEFKLKLCFQNDLIRFIGDKLDKISKLILVAANSYAYYDGICFLHFFLTIGLT
jgi:hypothetical protein